MTDGRRPIEVPRSFRELHEAGRFDYWAAPYRSLTDRDRERLILERTPRVLWWHTIEWNRTLGEILAPPSTETEYLRPGLFPFAGDNYGGQFCWYPRWSVGESEPPVVFAGVGDLDGSGLFARSFIECACRCFLQEHANWSSDDEPYPRETLWRAHLEILRPHLTPDLAAVLDFRGEVPSSEACESADREIAARVGERKLITCLLPVEYAESAVTTVRDLTLHEQSVAFYTELVEVEGYRELADRLREAEANLAAAASRLAVAKA